MKPCKGLLFPYSSMCLTQSLNKVPLIIVAYMETTSAIKLNIKHLYSLLKSGDAVTELSELHCEHSYNNEAIKAYATLTYDSPYTASLKVFHQIRELNAYEIGIISKPSNLGKGRLWFFVCPVTGNSCRILYYTNERNKFACKKAFKKLYYYNQLHHRCVLHSSDAFAVQESDKFKRLEAKYNKKHSKHHYKGKRTKWAQQLAKFDDRIEKSESKFIKSLEKIYKNIGA